MNEQGKETKEEAVVSNDVREHRPLNVTLDITVHDLQANLVKYCSPNEPPCPFLCVEKLVFEMDKSFRETRLQLLLSPVLLKVNTMAVRKKKKEKKIFNFFFSSCAYHFFIMMENLIEKNSQYFRLFLVMSVPAF